jgi:drug/metabolite transporter (DMT)-like permease
MTKLVIAFLIMISCTVAANLLMKVGAMTPAAERIFFELIGWKTFLGIFIFGCAAVIYAWLLHWLPLNVVQAFAAAQFVAVILASAIVLSESIPVARWIGILLIASGIVLVGFTSDWSSAGKKIPEAVRQNSK